MRVSCLDRVHPLGSPAAVRQLCALVFVPDRLQT
jgi:hypothetical protein